MKRKKILIADDSEINRAMLANILDRDFEIIEAASGQETLTALEAYHGEIAVLLLDMVMPGLDGVQVLEEMNRRRWIDSIPTIMIAAETGSAYIDRAFELGASDYISRPFTTGLIRRRVVNTILLYTRKRQLLDVIAGMAGPAAGETARRLVEGLYQDAAASRMTRQLETAHAKQDFFFSLADGLWFEYTAQPPALRLSHSAAERAGLPAELERPLENAALLARIGGETAERIRRQVEQLDSDHTYTEVVADIVLDGRPHRCQLCILVTWSAPEQGRYSSLLGRIVDIDDSCRRLEQLDNAAGQQTSQQVLLPVAAGEDGVLRISGSQIGLVMQSYRKMFRTVRLVDPEICMQVTVDAGGHEVDKNRHCYSVWGCRQRCERCISQDAVRTRTTRSKVESSGGEVFYVVSMCVEVDGVPYALECVNPIQSDDMQGGEENLLQQLLVRNRQVYTDSATHVFNRRYYDEHLRDLNGEYALAMIDMDHFKQINDRFGHPAGDASLHRVAQTLRSLLRSGDELVRYGGDEFFLLLRDLPEQAFQRRLDDLCQAVREIRMPEYPELRLTLSIGGVSGCGYVGQLVQKADAALYQAKKARDCAVIYRKGYDDAG